VAINVHEIPPVGKGKGGGLPIGAGVDPSCAKVCSVNRTWPPTLIGAFIGNIDVSSSSAHVGDDVATAIVTDMVPAVGIPAVKSEIVICVPGAVALGN
jgi:hypothetical protein